MACGRYVPDVGVPTFYGRVTLGEDVSLQLVRELPASVRWADLVHVTALWSPSSLLSLSLCLSPLSPLRRPLVLSPRGALLPWALSQRGGRKQSALRLLRPLLQRVQGWHATSEEEAEALARLRLLGPQAQVAVVGNGAPLSTEHPPRLQPEHPQVQRLLTTGAPRIVTLGRVHPVKNLELAIRSLAHLRRLRGHDQATLMVIGPERAGEPYGDQLRQLAATLGIADAVSFVGLQKGAIKDQLLAGSDVLWLPSHMESFGNVVVEALAVGTPVVAAQTTPWQDLELHRVGRWVPPDAQHFAEATALLLALRSRAEWAAHCQAIAVAHYSWSQRERALRRLYDAVLGRATSASPSARP